MLYVISSETWKLIILAGAVFGGPLLIYIFLIRPLGKNDDES